MTSQSSDEYGAAIGSVMEARKQYDAACAEQGPDSWAAQQAQESLTHKIAHRTEMRELHDAAGSSRSDR